MPAFVKDQHTVRKATHHQYFDLWSLNGELIGQIYAAHPWHLKVCKKKMDLAFEFLGSLNSFYATSADQNVELTGQKSRDEVQDRRVVIKNRLVFSALLSPAFDP